MDEARSLTELVCLQLFSWLRLLSRRFVLGLICLRSVNSHLSYAASIAWHTNLNWNLVIKLSIKMSVCLTETLTPTRNPSVGLSACLARCCCHRPSIA